MLQKILFTLSAIVVFFPVIAQVKSDTIWLKNNRVVPKEEADRYQEPVSQREGIYIFSGNYKNGNPFISGYARKKRNDGTYHDGEIKRFFENGQLDRVTTMGEDTTTVTDAAGVLLFLADRQNQTEYYAGGKPTRRISRELAVALRKRHSLTQMADSGLFRNNKIPELELFYENGQRAAVVHSSKNRYVSYYENGQKAMHITKQGNGYLLESYFRNGKTRNKYVLNTEFKYDGVYSLYYENGIMREQGTKMANDIYKDTCFTYRYYPNGRLFAKIKSTVSDSDGEITYTAVDIPGEPARPNPAPEKKPGPTRPPVAFCYDLAGRNLVQYHSANYDRDVMNQLFSNQVQQLMKELLTAEEKKYPLVTRDSVDYDGYNSNRSKQPFIFKKTRALLNGGYIILHDGIMKIAYFTEGVPAKEKVFIGFEEEYGLFRLPQTYAGLDVKKRYVERTGIYDRDSYNIIDLTTKTWDEKDFFCHRYGATEFDVSQPVVHFDIVPHIVLLVEEPGLYLFDRIYPSLKITPVAGNRKTYTEQMEEVEKLLQEAKGWERGNR